MAAIEKPLYEIMGEIMESEGFGDVKRIAPAARLREDLGFDSLALAVLTVKLENEFGVDVFERGLVHTVAEVIERIANAPEKAQ